MLNVEQCKVIQQCALLIKDAFVVSKGQKDRDRERAVEMQNSISVAEKDLDKTFREFSTYKGRYFVLHDAVINKNLLSQDLENLNNVYKKQNVLINDPNELPKHNDELNARVR